MSVDSVTSLLESDDDGDRFGDTMKSVGGISVSSGSALNLLSSTVKSK